MTSQPQADREGESGESAVKRVESSLRFIRARARTTLIGTVLAWILAGALAFVLADIALDYLLRMPGWMRGALLGVGIGLGIAAAVRWLVPAWRFRPALTEVALRVERTESARTAGLGGMLASGLELADGAPGPAGRWMSGRVVSDVSRRFASFRPRRLYRAGGAVRSCAALTLLLLVAALSTWLAGAERSRIAAARALTPWSGAQWPRRTLVADMTAARVHPLGTALPLRAALVRSDSPPHEGRVVARFRVLGPEGPGPLQRVILSPQFRDVAVGDEGQEGELYEQLVEPGLLGPAASGEMTLEYWFESSDDGTEPRRVRMVQPPAVLAARAQIKPPDYAASLPTDGTIAGRFAAGARDLGNGTDQRAIVGPVLTGSRITLTLGFNKSMPQPPAEEPARSAWIASSLPGADFGPDAAVRFDDREWAIEWTLNATTRVPIAARDEHGLTSPEEAAFTFDGVEDRPPTASVTVPEQDEAVLPSAVIAAAGEARDDVAVATVRLEAQVARRPGGSLGAAPEAVGEPAAIASVDGPDPLSPGQALVEGRVALEPFALNPGDELWLTTLAVDGYELAGARHDPVRSAPRRLRVVSEEELIEQMRGELAGVREAAIRLDQEQAQLADAAGRALLTPEDRARQAAIGPRLEQQRQIVERLSDRAVRNQLDDGALTGLLDDVRDALQGAEQAARRAGARADEAARDRPDDEPVELTPEQAGALRSEQEQVRDELGRLIELLDKGEDGWVVRRDLQRILEQQRDLRRRTGEAGDRTVGRDAQDLTQQERDELARLAQEQQRLAEQTRQALDTMDRRSEQMREVDAAQAAAMQEAARQGREQQVPERMDQASQQTQQNQTSSAQQQQQQAVEALEQMLDELENADRNRDESLRRLLASLIESLDGLIRRQEQELEALGGARTGARAFEGLDAGMILLHQNTLGVLGEAKAAFREMRRVAELIEAAAGSQQSSVAALRASPPDGDAADRDEQASLRSLRAARTEAQRIEDEAEQRDQDRKRQELRRVYREVLEQQVVLRDDTTPLVDRDPDRRERMKIRGLGEKEETLRKTLDDLRLATEELADAGIFAFAHEQLDATLARVVKQLRGGSAPASVRRDQESVILLLRALVEALAENPDQNDEFREEEAGGEGGSGQGGSQPEPLIPDMAQLRLLRGIQSQIGQLTRTLDEAAAPTPSEMDSLGKMQEDLARHGEELVEKLQRPRPGAPPDGPGGE